MIRAGNAADRVHLARGIAVGLLAALVALGVAWELWLAPTGAGTLAIKVLPLLLALPGLLRHRLYTYRWLSLLLWLYVAEGLVRANTDVGLSRWLALLEIVIGLLLFTTCVVYIRRRLQAGTSSAAA